MHLKQVNIFTILVMSELLFESYDVPAISYGVDSLFSFHQNHPCKSDGLIISFGYHTTHVMPVLNGIVCSDKVRRINLGGYHMITYMHRLLQLKYPVHTTAVTLSRIEWMLHNHCSVAVDYMESLRQWASYEYYEQNVKKIQLSFNVPTTNTTLTAEQKIEKKRELAKRLVEINARKRDSKLIEDQAQLERMHYTLGLHEDGEIEEFNSSLELMNISNLEELEV